jgi:hypothetical protein
MPIRPENLARYPKDWPEISAAIRKRAGNRCEWTEGGRRCTCMQYAVGHWVRRDSWVWVPVEGNRPSTTEQDRAFWMAGEGRGADGEPWAHRDARAFVDHWVWDQWKPTVIVLTVAHLNHEPEDCRPENLAAWCQRHHLAYDHAHHRTNAQASRRARLGQPELFGP